MFNNWHGLVTWLHSPAADWFVDAAITGDLPKYEAEEILEDWGIIATAQNLRKLAVECNCALLDKAA